MISRCGRFVISFNGEVYNYLFLREKLEKMVGSFPWRGHSDTEVLLESIAHCGLLETLSEVNGMFAFALWDRQQRVLSLARDPIGEKPLYYGWSRGTFLFASELKALRKHPSWEGRIDQDSLNLFLRYNYVPAPLSIFQRVYKLNPGSCFSLSMQEMLELPTGPSGNPTPVPYWNTKEVMRRGMEQPFQGDLREAQEEVEKLLTDSVRLRMVADVPVGVFLSGGIDSSTVAALMQNQSSRPIKTFTIGFYDRAFNEAENAKAIAAHLGTEHNELYVTSKEALEIIPLLPETYDEPFADSSQIPTYLVSKLARGVVTVVLSGDGGDELFCGYNRYVLTNRYWSLIEKIPYSIRGKFADLSTIIRPRLLDSALRHMSFLFPPQFRNWISGDRCLKGLDLAASRDLMSFYDRAVSYWPTNRGAVRAVQSKGNPALSTVMDLPTSNDFNVMMLLDQISYLPDDILVKVDRASMANSLEGRIPLLDPRIIRLAWQLPLEAKIFNGQGKIILRNILLRHLPRHMVDRPKQGFGIPIHSWLRGPLRDWVEDLLDESNLRREGYLRVDEVRNLWSEHATGQRNWGYRLWGILMFQTWLRNQ